MKTSNKILFFQLATFILFAIGFMIFLGNNLEPNPWKQDVTYKTGKIDNVNVGGAMLFEARKGDEDFFKINTSGPVEDIADVEFDSSQLTIITKERNERGNGRYGKDLEAYAKLENLAKLTANGDSWVNLFSIEEKYIEISAKDECSFRTYKVDIDTMKLDMEGHSRAELKGEINVLILNAKDSTDINVEDLYVNKIIVNLEDKAKLEVRELDEISGTIPNESSIQFPENHKIKTSLKIVK